MYLIAGLGNPGLKYRHTRHNAGFEAIDVIADQYGIKMGKEESKAKVGRGRINGQDVLLVKPQTYMNNSGESIGPLASYYKIDPKTQVIVLCDDVMLDPGRMRIRKKGSAGGHNGLKSIIQHLGTEEFTRVRLGVGKLEPEGDMVKHVLGHLPKEDRIKLERIYEDSCGVVEMLLEGRIDDAMSKYNGIQE